MTSSELDTLSVALVGSGGSGVMTAGGLLLEVGARAGLGGIMTRSSGPQIRGGEAAALLRLGPRPVQSHGDRFDLLLGHRAAGELPRREQLGDAGLDDSGGRRPITRMAARS